MGLIRKADDKIRRQRNIRTHHAQFVNDIDVLLRAVAAFHGGQNSVRARLHGQMQMIDQLRYFGERANQAVIKMIRVAGGKSNALDAFNVRHGFEQSSKVGNL